MAEEAPHPRTGSGIPVDSTGGPTVDPTRNVLDLVNAANKRQDDLREAFDKLNASKFEHLEAMAVLRADHQREMALKEAMRLDSVRMIDVEAVRTAYDRALNTIATQAATTAAAAAALATQTATANTSMAESIAALQKSMYEGQGKQQVADPQMAQLISVVGRLAERDAQGAGKDEGKEATWKAISLAMGILLAFLAIWTFTQKNAPVYVPVPEPGVTAK